MCEKPGGSDDGQMSAKPKRAGEWSREEMEKAQPYPMPEVDDEDDGEEHAARPTEDGQASAHGA